MRMARRAGLYGKNIFMIYKDGVTNTHLVQTESYPPTWFRSTYNSPGDSGGDLNGQLFVDCGDRSQDTRTILFSSKKVDVTNYKLLCAQVDYAHKNYSASPSFGIGNNYYGFTINTNVWDEINGVRYYCNVLPSSAQAVSNTVFTIDISAVTGSYYVGLDTAKRGEEDAGTIRVSKLWLEQ